jgi:hypothetical protein
MESTAMIELGDDHDKNVSSGRHSDGNQRAGGELLPENSIDIGSEGFSSSTSREEPIAIYVLTGIYEGWHKFSSEEQATAFCERLIAAGDDFVNARW